MPMSHTIIASILVFASMPAMSRCEAAAIALGDCLNVKRQPLGCASPAASLHQG